MPKRVLIVDDEPRYLRLLDANLRTEGYEVVTAQDGSAGRGYFFIPAHGPGPAGYHDAAPGWIWRHPAHPRILQRAHHHPHRQRRGTGPRARPRPRRGRLPCQTLLGHRTAGTRARRPAPRPTSRPKAGRRASSPTTTCALTLRAPKSGAANRMSHSRPPNTACSCNSPTTSARSSPPKTCSPVSGVPNTKPTRKSCGSALPACAKNWRMIPTTPGTSSRARDWAISCLPLKVEWWECRYGR